MNNFEKIKQMSVDEMADMFAEIQNENDYFCCVVGCRSKHCMFSVCVEAIKQYLLQEVEE